MYSQATATKTREASRQHVNADVLRFSADIGRDPTSSAVNRTEPLPPTASNRTERDRQASLEFLHRLVMGADGD